MDQSGFLDCKVTLNKVIMDERFSIPSIEDMYIYTKNGGKLFCTLDISNVYLHMSMHDKSAEMQINYTILLIGYMHIIY